MIAGLTTADLSLETLLSKCNELAGALNLLQPELQKKDELIALHKEQLQEKDLQLLKLHHELAQLKKLVFGSKSERFQPQNTGQLALALNEEPTPVAAPLPTQNISYQRQKAAKTGKHPGRLPLPAHLPRKQVILEPVGVDTSLWKRIGQEITEELDYTPCRFFVRQYVRPKYAHPSGAGVLIADLPQRPIPKGVASAALLAHVISSKFLYHMPVERQAEKFKREGVALPVSTLHNWIKAPCQLIEPLYQLHRQQVLCSDYLQIDESPIQVLDKTKKGRSHRGWHWVYHAPEKGLVLFDYRPGRGREGPSELLKNFSGYLQSDGYIVYEDYAGKQGIVLLGCMAHARRKFVEAEKNDAPRAAYVLGQLQKLYALERKGKEDKLDEQAFLTLRQQQAVPILEQLKAWLLENYQQVTPQSPIGKAIAYALPRWEKLSAYVSDARLHIDNNLVENAIRPLALGRKNYMFAGSHQGARRAAMLYSFMGSCKLHQINPEQWLTDVLSRIGEHQVNKLQQLLPGNWTPAPTPYSTENWNPADADPIAK
jgi:transposase